MINLERNAGRKAFNKGAEIKQLLALPSLAKRQAEPLTDQSDVEWTGSASIGSNNQPFTIDFDTGSSDLWVPNARKCNGCEGHKTYDASKSKTSKSQKGSFSIQYGDNSTVSGPIFKDTGEYLHLLEGYQGKADNLLTVSVAGVKVTSQTFSAVTELSSAFQSDPLDGILGMAYQSISQLNAVCGTLLEFCKFGSDCEPRC